MSDAARRVREAVSGSPFLTQTTQSGWTVAQKALRGHKLKAYFAANPRVRLMIGSGPSKLDGWLATDLIPSRPDVVLLDANDPFPFDDATVDRIHTEHMIEHVDHPVGTHMLAECFRILKPGGRLRILTPDFDRVIALTQDPGDEVTRLARESNLRNGIDPAVADDPIYAVNRLFSGYGHRFLYTEAALSKALADAGFTGIHRYPVGDTEDPDFADVDQHGNQINEAWNDYQTLVLEADKPA